MAYRKFDTCFFERYAQLTLETILGCEYSNLVNKYRPDLPKEANTLGTAGSVKPFLIFFRVSKRG